MTDFLIWLMGDGKGDWGGPKITCDPFGFGALAVFSVMLVRSIKRGRNEAG